MDGKLLKENTRVSEFWPNQPNRIFLKKGQGNRILNVGNEKVFYPS
jgi:hypothetical protein